MFCNTSVRNVLSVQNTSKPATNQKNASVKRVQRIKKPAQEFKNRRGMIFLKYNKIIREITIARSKL